MKLINLTTSGFKKLDKFECDFTTGLNVIVGDNAAGKSTLLQALDAALHGPSVLPGNKDHVTTWGRDRWTLSLTFEIKGDVYTVTRTKSTAKLMKGDSLEANGSSPVNKHIEELMGLTAKDYNLFMQSKQGETTGILTFGATALSRKVEEFAGISLIDSVQQLASTEWTQNRAKAEAMMPSDEALAELEQEEHALLAKEAEASLEVAGIEKDLADLPKAADVISEYGQSPKEMREAASNISRQERAYRAQVAKVENAEQARKHCLETWQEAKADLDAADKPEAESYQQLHEANKDAKGNIRHCKWMSTTIRQLETEVATCNANLKVINEALEKNPDPSEEIERYTPQAAKAEQDFVDANEDLIEERARLKQLTQMSEGAECPTCGTFLADHDPMKLTKEISAVEEVLLSKQYFVDTMRETAANAKKYLEELKVIANKRVNDQLAKEGNETLLAAKEEELKACTSDATADEYDAEMERLQAVVAKNLAKASAAEDDAARYQRMVKREANRKSQHVEAEREHADAVEELEQMPQTNAEDIDKLQAAADELDEKLAKVRADESRCKDALADAKRGYSEIVTRLKYIEECKADFAASKAKADEYAKAADQGGRLSRFLRDHRGEYLTEVWNTVIGVASRQVNTASQGKIQSLAYQDGEFVFEEEGMLAPVGCASGAQKAHIGVALRIGLSRALYGSDALLIFDEPTESMREHNAVGLSASLASAGSQVLLITHREQDQDLAHNIIEVG